MPSEDQLPILTKQKISFKPQVAVVHLQVANNIVLLALVNGTLLRIPLSQQEAQDDIEVTKSPSEKIIHLHMDPTGQHVIISTNLGEVYYLHVTMKKPRVLGRMKGNIIPSVGWNSEAVRENTTGFITIGTTKGQLYETEISVPQIDKSGNRPANVLYWHLLTTFPVDETGQSSEVTNVYMNKCPSSGGHWFLIATTPSQFYLFRGMAVSDSPALQNLFLSDIETAGLISVSNSSYRSFLRLFFTEEGQEGELSYAWMADATIHFGIIDTSQLDCQKMLTRRRIYECPSKTDAKSKSPLDMVLTQFHFVILYQDRLTAVCLLNNQTVHDDKLDMTVGKLVGLARDSSTKLIWVHSDFAIIRYQFHDETRHVWRMYLNANDFSNARRLCGQNPANLDLVLQKEAIQLFKDKKYTAAAEIFAISQMPFEEVSLKFLEISERNGLKTYLTKKLEFLNPADKTLCAMVILWLIEIHLTDLGEANSGALPHSQRLQEQTGETRAYDNSRFKMLWEQFRIFLNKKEVLDCIQANQQAVCQIMAVHGDLDCLQYFAELMKDFKAVVSLLIQRERYDAALTVLSKQDDVKLFYKFSPELMAAVPKKLVELWISKAFALKPKRLLPSMVNAHSDPVQAAEAIRYLEFCINAMQSNDQAVHNYLLALYAKTSVDKVLPFLTKQGEDPSKVCYDLKYALRLCSEHQLDRACVHIYTTMGLHEEAVELALIVDVNLAKTCAKQADVDEETKKKLWLCVARHVVETERDIKKCMELLAESENVIKIQDILPFFPDFVTIDHFKEPLCACLAEHSGRILSLQDEMKEANDAAQVIKQQLLEHRKKYAVIKVNEKCSSCGEPLMVRSFYSFSCRHNFHTDCMEREVTPLMGEDFKNRIKEIRRQLTLAKVNEDSMSGDSTSISSSQIQTPVDGLRQELDELFAAECAFCSDAAIELVAKPFYIPTDYLAELKSWE